MEHKCAKSDFIIRALDTDKNKDISLQNPIWWISRIADIINLSVFFPPGGMTTHGFEKKAAKNP